MSEVVLYLGDCLEIMSIIPDGSVDMILCDLPYGTTACKWDTVIPFEPLWKQYKRVIKKNGAIVLTASQPFTAALGASQIQLLRYSWVWEKLHATGHLNAKKRPRKGHEDVLVFYASQPTYNPQELVYVGKSMTNSRSDCARGKGNTTSTVTGGMKQTPYTQEFTNYPDGILRIKSANGNKEHPTQKPVPLMEYLIKTYTNEGELVLDNCMGSGTTGVACKNLGRNFIGIEKDPGYFEIAKKRTTEAQCQRCK